MEHPRLYRAATAPPKRDWIDVVFTWGIFVWLMWAIWAPVALGALILMIILL